MKHFHMLFITLVSKNMDQMKHTMVLSGSFR